MTELHLHLIDRATAKAHGLKRYFTGEPCNIGGIGERSTSDKKCQCKHHREKNKDKCRKRYKEKRDYECARKRSVYVQNKDCLLAKTREWRNKNRDRDLAKKKEYYNNNRDKFKAMHKSWKQSNNDLMRYYQQNKRANRKLRKPSWFTELDEFVLQQCSKLCDLRKQSTGFDWHIDHMIPLQAKNVCGLHVWNNLQVIPGYLNTSKRNKLIFTEPNEWLEYLCKQQKGVDFDMDKMRAQLNSGANELPEYKTTEDLHQWMKAKRLERRNAHRCAN